MDEALPEPPHGFRLRARMSSALQALEAFGIVSALQALLLGPAHFQALQRIWHIEPLLFRPIESDSIPDLERTFARPSDIYAHLPTLYWLTVDAGRKRILELGTRDGDSTVALLLAAREIDGQVTSVDIAPCPVAHARVEAGGLQDRWTFLQRDDLALEWTAPIDHLFIDTTHEFAQTLNELRKYEPFVAPGGAISMHDTTSCPTVWRAVDQYFRGRRDVRIFRYYHNNGLAVIEKRPSAAR